MGNAKHKMLIVEDEVDICTYAQSFFARRGFAVSTTGSGLEALSIIKASRPDIVLLDISLNDLNGIEVLKKLREHDKQTRVIIITGLRYSDEEIKERISIHGISGYREKPYVLAEIEKLVCEVLGIQSLTPVAVAAASGEGQPLSQKGIVHQLSNLLGIIRGQCENFTLNMEDGVYKDKSQQDLLKMSLRVMHDVQSTVDRAMKVVEQIKEK